MLSRQYLRPSWVKSHTPLRDMFVDILKIEQSYRDIHSRRPPLSTPALCVLNCGASDWMYMLCLPRVDARFCGVARMYSGLLPRRTT